jgi:hypothetical protein
MVDMSNGEHAHQRIDLMPEAALHNAPVDDEPETNEEAAAVLQARQWLDQNNSKAVPHEEAMRLLGLD